MAGCESGSPSSIVRPVVLNRPDMHGMSGAHGMERDKNPKMVVQKTAFTFDAPSPKRRSSGRGIKNGDTDVLF